ncbi:hypothetical protein AGMMS49938_12830 [Fibrobacterales bacterium]|nr:hypothetical protein AGMMS49938_12830 [Fibrobacterales bacterium]
MNCDIKKTSTALRAKSVAFLIFLPIVFISCELPFSRDDSPVIAEVGNSTLTINELKRQKIAGDSVSKEEWVRRIDSWVNFEVMYKEALDRGLRNDPEVRKLIKDAERKILVDKMRLSLDSPLDSPSDEELQNYYEKNKEQYQMDSVPFAEVQTKIRSILVSEKRAKREKHWLTEIKNNYTIEVYPQYLDSLRDF